MIKIPAFVLVAALGILSLLTIPGFPVRVPLKPFIVLSGSMRPAIGEGSVVFVQRGFSNLQTGDIITYIHPHNVRENITHRITAIKSGEDGKKYFQTKGDANDASDSWQVAPEAVWGKVAFSVPFLGYLISFARTRPGVILLVALPLAVIAFDELRIIFMEMRRWRRKRAAVTAVILAGWIIIQPAKAVWANFTETVSVTGLTVTTADDFTPPSASLSATGSWTKTVEEKVDNGGFESGLAGWTAAGQVTTLASDSITNPGTTVTPYSGLAMARIGRPTNPGNYVWENRLMQSLPAGAKSLSLYYNFFSRDADPYDLPGFLVRLNGQEIFSKNNLGSDGTNHLSTGWQEFFYDLSDITGPQVNLAIYAGNTGDTNAQSWAYVDKITTYFVSAPGHATYNLSGSDNPGGSGINHYEYRLDGGSWQTGATFNISPNGTHTLEYRAVDNAGNSSAVSLVKVVTDTTAPAAVTDLTVGSVASNSAVLSWTAPGNDGSSGRAAKYDVRYSTLAITDDASFNSATQVSKIPAPKEAGEAEQVEILGLNSATTYYFALKTADEAPNWSALSNAASSATVAGAAANAGDVIINELMWMGSSVSAYDEWLELRNMADRTIDLSGFKLVKYDGSDMGVNFSGKSIAPHVLFLVTNYAPGSGSTRLKSSVTADLVDPGLTISNDNLEITLKAPDGTVIDIAGDGAAPTAGLYNSGAGKYYSMERTEVPGDGTNPLSWYTTIDSASTADFFTSPGDQRGTPGAANRSNNEPVPGPTAKLTLAPDGKSLSYIIINLDDTVTVSYLLTYDTDTAPQGVKGSGRSGAILLGTCSTGGTCVYNTGAKNFHFSATLTGPAGRTMNLEASL